MKSRARSITTILIVVTALAASSPGQTRTRQMVFDADSAFFIQGLGALVLAKDDKLLVEMMPQKEQIPKELQDVDLKKDDEIMMLNGKRVKTIEDLREQYDAIEVGAEVQFGVKNEEGMKIVSYDKPSGEQSGGAVMMMTTTMDGDGPGGIEQTESRIIGPDGAEISVTPVFDAGIMITEREDGVEIAAVMPDAKEKLHGDLPSGGERIVAVNGKKTASLYAFQEMYDAIAIGETVTLTCEQDGVTRSFSFERSNETPSTGTTVERRIEK